jgi:hypothetical protein
VRGSPSGGAGSLVARLDDRLEGLALVLEVPLGRLDEVGDEVVAALELDVDLRPALADVLPQADEAVKVGDEPGEGE